MVSAMAYIRINSPGLRTANAMQPWFPLCCLITSDATMHSDSETIGASASLPCKTESTEDLISRGVNCSPSQSKKLSNVCYCTFSSKFFDLSPLSSRHQTKTTVVPCGRERMQLPRWLLQTRGLLETISLPDSFRK